MQQNLTTSFLDRLKTFFNYQIRMRFGSTKSRFTQIFKEQGWGEFESISGPGSSISNTLDIRKGLEKVIKDNSVKSILDIPCGDFNWMKEVNLSGIDYLGADIVSELVMTNNKKYKQSNINFTDLNLIKDNLPKVDLIISRDCFIHFSYEDTFRSLDNIKRSKSKFLLASTYPDVKENINIRTGFNYNINLQAAPFNFSEPVVLIEEKQQKGEKHGRKCMGLWAVDSIITP